MTNNEIYLVVRNIIIAATDCPTVIKYNQNQQAPGGDYCAVSVGQPKRQRGQAIIKRSNTAPVSSPIGNVLDVNHNIYAQVISDVSINFYRGLAFDYAGQLFQANKRADVSELLFTSALGWRSTSTINNLTALQSNEWEDRAQITLSLFHELDQTVTTNAIYSVAITAENEDGDTLTTVTVDAPTEP